MFWKHGNWNAIVCTAVEVVHWNLLTKHVKIIGNFKSQKEQEEALSFKN